MRQTGFFSVLQLVVRLAVLSLAVMSLAQAAPALAAGTPTATSKQTTLGLYLTSKEAYAMWAANQTIPVIDVRTPEEYVFVGHAPMARNIPIRLFTTTWNSASSSYSMTANSNFVTQVSAIASPSATIIVMCGTGSRSATAVNTLAANGFTRAYTVVDGFEGDRVSDTESYYNAKYMRNGWKNAGLEWTYSLDQSLVYRP